MRRVFDLAVALAVAVFLALPILIVSLAVRLTSPGPILYWSDRVGRNNRIFRMPKFRSMRIDAPAVATHRKSSLDGLPQLWSILFVFLISINVNGEITAPRFPFSADQQPHPGDPYGVSRMEAEFWVARDYC